jgi:hypothetical protein
VAWQSQFLLLREPSLQGQLDATRLIQAEYCQHTLWACCGLAEVSPCDQFMCPSICPSDLAPRGDAAPPVDVSGVIRLRKITIADPQHLHLSFGRALSGGGAQVCVPGAQDVGEFVFKPMRSIISRWRCLQLECARPKLRERRNPLGRTCCNTSQRKCAPLTVRFSLLPVLLSR